MGSIQFPNIKAKPRKRTANPLSAVNRGGYISNDLPFLRSLNDGCIDPACIDPPFARNDTY